MESIEKRRCLHIPHDALFCKRLVRPLVMATSKTNWSSHLSRLHFVGENEDIPLFVIPSGFSSVQSLPFLTASAAFFTMRETGFAQRQT